MNRSARLAIAVLGIGAWLVIAGSPGHATAPAPVVAPPSRWALTPLALLSRPIPDATPNAAQLRRGQYLVAAGDCMSCHLREGGEPLAGGLGMKTPFGVIYTANITPDRETGIGDWTNDQFYRAMHDGVDDEGKNLYPAFPYPWFALASREDDDAILAFLRTVPAVSYTPPKDHLPFPLNFRGVVKVWNALFLSSHDPQPDPKQSAEWNRGAYLVNGLGHCGGCHSPRNAMGAEETSRHLHGARIENWVASDLTANDRTGLGAWSIDDVAEYLRNGRNARASAGGAMAEVITYSTSLMSDEDRHAMAVYLKSQPATPGSGAATADAAAMRRGAAIYSDACSSCHLDDGVGQARLFPPLGHNASLQQADATGVEHVILAGGRTGTSPSRPSPLTMPAFAWKLSDREVADVATYIRNSWGNEAKAVSVSEVREMRRRLDLDTLHYTNNSGDQD